MIPPRRRPHTGWVKRAIETAIRKRIDEREKPMSGKPKHAWQCSLCGKTFTAFTDPHGDGTRSMWIQEYAHIKACPKAPRPGRKQK